MRGRQQRKGERRRENGRAVDISASALRRGKLSTSYREPLIGARIRKLDRDMWDLLSTIGTASFTNTFGPIGPILGLGPIDLNFPREFLAMATKSEESSKRPRAPRALFHYSNSRLSS